MNIDPHKRFVNTDLLRPAAITYEKEGVYWLATILKNSSRNVDQDLENSTIYYLKTFIRKYIYNNRENIRKSPELMADVLLILEFLIEKGEISGYLLRESIV